MPLPSAKEASIRVTNLNQQPAGTKRGNRPFPAGHVIANRFTFASPSFPSSLPAQLKGRREHACCCSSSSGVATLLIGLFRSTNHHPQLRSPTTVMNFRIFQDFCRGESITTTRLSLSFQRGWLSERNGSCWAVTLQLLLSPTLSPHRLDLSTPRAIPVKSKRQCIRLMNVVHAGGKRKIPSCRFHAPSALLVGDVGATPDESQRGDKRSAPC